MEPGMMEPGVRVGQEQSWARVNPASAQQSTEAAAHCAPSISEAASWADGGMPSLRKNNRAPSGAGDSQADRKGTLILPCTLLMATTWPRRRWTMEGRSAARRVGASGEDFLWSPPPAPCPPREEAASHWISRAPRGAR